MKGSKTPLSAPATAVSATAFPAGQDSYAPSSTWRPRSSKRAWASFSKTRDFWSALSTTATARVSSPPDDRISKNISRVAATKPSTSRRSTCQCRGSDAP